MKYLRSPTHFSRVPVYNLEIYTWLKSGIVVGEKTVNVFVRDTA